MTNYPESGIKLVADTKDYTKAMDDAIFLADYFDSLGDMVLNISAELDTSGVDVSDLPLDGETVNFTLEADIEGDLGDLPLDGETVNYTVDATVEGDLEDLPLQGETVNFTADGTVEGAAADLPADGETIDTKLDVEATDATAKTLSAVETIKNLKILETVWNIAGTAVDLFGKFQSFAVQPMLSLDEAVARVNATTGNAIPNARELIKNIFYDDLGSSIEQVGNMVTKAGQLKLPIDEAVRAALEFTHTFTDENPERVLDTLNQLVINKLAPNFKTAGDMLVTAFQNGANKGGDLLTAINDNATAINGLGLTGPEALGFIKTGLDAGFKSADEVLKVLEKIKQNVQNAAGNETSDVSQTLKTLGIANPAETGEAWTSEFFTKVIEGIKNAPGLTDTEKEAMFSNLVGGKLGGKTFSAFLQLSPADADNVFANMAGASERAALAIDDSLTGAIDDFMLAANKAAQDFLSSDQIDLPGKIAALKTGLQDGLDVLANEGTLGEALTVALKPIGFDDEFQGLEAMLGNFVIAILQVVSSIQSLDPANWKAKEGTDATIAKLSETQLTFDLQVGNPDEVSTEISTAVSRGVSPDKITAAVGGAINELIADGSEEALAKAQALIDTLNAPVDMNKVPLLANGTPMNVEPVVTTDALAGFQKQLDDAKPVTVNVMPSTDSTDMFLDTIMPVSTETDKLATNSDAAATAVQAQNTATVAATESTVAATTATTDLATQTEAQQTAATNATLPTKNVAENTKKYGDAAKIASSAASDAAGGISASAYQMQAIAGIAPAAASGLEGVASALQVILDKANAVGVAADNLSKKNGSTGGSGGSGGAGTAKVEPHFTGTASTGVGVFSVGEKGREILTTNQDLAVLNNMTTDAIMAAMQSFTPGGSYKGSSGSTNIINNTNYIPNQATADALGYRQAEVLRGMG